MTNWLPVSDDSSSDDFTRDRRLRVFLVCPGLGHVNRGFETFTRSASTPSGAIARLDLYLYKGAGPTADRERAVWCLRRNRAATRALGTMIRRDAYYVEQTTFALASSRNWCDCGRM